MRVRLTRKLAESVDGVDLSAYGVGDVLDVPPADAHLLIAENWAVPEETVRAGETDDTVGSRRRRGGRRSDAR